MKKLGLMAVLAILSSNAFAEGQVFYRYGLSTLSESRGGQTFTDTGAANGKMMTRVGMALGPVWILN